MVAATRACAGRGAGATTSIEMISIETMRPAIFATAALAVLRHKRDRKGAAAMRVEACEAGYAPACPPAQ